MKVIAGLVIGVFLTAVVALATVIDVQSPTNSALLERFHGLMFTKSAVVTTDTQVKATPGFLHCIVVSENDAAPTAGTIIVYDNTAESGTQVFNWTLTTAVFMPFQICPDIVMTTGIYIGFTTTNDVNVSVSYR